MEPSRERNTSRMLCDAHIHFIPEELSAHTSFYKGVWSDKEALFRFLDRYDIEKALLVYPSTDAHINLGSRKKECEIYNNALEDLRQEDERIIPSCIIDIDSDIKSQIEALYKRGFRVISLASSYDGRFRPDVAKLVAEKVREYGLIVFIHPQTINPIGYERLKDPLIMPVLEYSFDISACLGLFMMEGILEEDVKFLFSSLAGVIPFLKNRFDRVYNMLKAYTRAI